MLTNIMNNHDVNLWCIFQLRRKTSDLSVTTVPGQFEDIHSLDKLRDHDVISGTLKIFVTHRRFTCKVYLYQKENSEAMKKDALKFAREDYFNVPDVSGKLQPYSSFMQKAKDEGIPWV